MNKSNKTTLLLGEGIHQHTLYGNHRIESDHSDFAEIVVDKDSELRHEHPNGSFGEHKTLKVNKGRYRMGLQVEWNPFSQTVSRVWD
jgi:hypothetical protein